MAPGCSICRHQQRALIDVSLLREGTRFTARQFQVSRPSLDRHKKHLSQSVAIADQTREIAASSDESTPLLSQLEMPGDLLQPIGKCRKVNVCVNY